MSMRKHYMKQNGECRPGGIELTLHAFELSAFLSSDKILDICCGNGKTVHELRKLGYNIFGIDKALQENGSYLINADAAELPFCDNSFQGLIMECALSDVSDPKPVLFEAFRVLQPGKLMVLTDLYAKRIPIQTIFRLELRQMIEKRLIQSGFQVLLWEDHTRELKQFLAQIIMNDGIGELCTAGIDKELFRKAGCGYYLLIARKEKDI